MRSQAHIHLIRGRALQCQATRLAFFGDPSLVVLDEPNSNLDAAGEQALTETLQRAKKRGVTAVVVTLRPALLNSVDKVLILRSGRAEAFGSPSDVLHRLVRSNGGAGGDSKEQPRRIEPSNPAR